MERYRELNKDIEKLNEWRQNHIDTRETYLQLSNQLAQRRRQLISELCLIYPIRQVYLSIKNNLLWNCIQVERLIFSSIL